MYFKYVFQLLVFQLLHEPVGLYGLSICAKSMNEFAVTGNQEVIC